MAKLEHRNLHPFGDKAEVYAALQRDYNRDTWRQLFWRYGLLVSALGGAFESGHKDWLWLFAGLFCVERCIARYIDNSNRNWAMHVIDWLESGSGSAP
jgi:hypothetical protein